MESWGGRTQQGYYCGVNEYQLPRRSLQLLKVPLGMGDWEDTLARVCWVHKLNPRWLFLL